MSRPPDNERTHGLSNRLLALSVDVGSFKQR